VSFYGLLLLPFSLLYGLVTWIRNKLFDWGILKEIEHQIPIISVGNLSMGGTGKTPMIEYLIRLLKDEYKLAALSRGYGRKTKGFVLANKNSKAIAIGDEPLQYALKFDSIHVAVSENRNKGVQELIKSVPDLDLVLLDDAFQHRYIKPGLNILLTEFYRLYTDNYVFPSGSLREFRFGAERADIVVVTKTPITLSPITRRRIAGELHLKKHQLLLFSKIEYGDLIPYSFFNLGRLKKRYANIILFTGIANNYPLQDHLRQICSELTVLTFSDHHHFNQKDVVEILKAYNNIFGKNKILVTTEKDIMRLKDFDKMYLFNEIPLLYIPIHTVFHNGDGDLLADKIKSYLSNSKRLIKEV